ncbi:RNA polymerase sigma factor [Fibrella aquatica]|jgi:RNA polymerase sigma factor (sigma-70 family)|uniref:RNA polymerase sigma factor n=1 Tax=Fibrella aquatica TaxID=3242487 RepID=UPI003520E372
MMFDDEAHLWSAFQRGDINAFEVIYERHSASLLAYGKRLCADHHLIKDLVQDIFIDIWTSRKTLRDLHTIRYYLFKIMRNRLAKLHQRTPSLVHDDQSALYENLLSPSIEHLITQQETDTRQLSQLQHAITQLPERQREAIMLAFYHDFSNDEIAGIMNINHQSVINHLNRALSNLRELVLRSPLLVFFLNYFF